MSTLRRIREIQWKEDVDIGRVAQTIAENVDEIIRKLRTTGNAKILVSQRTTREQIRRIVVRELATSIQNIKEALIPTAEIITDRIVEVLKRGL